MKVFKEWEWKYKIFFDSELKDSLISFYDQYKEDEKVILRELVDFYSGFFTFQILLDALNDDNLINENVIEKAQKNIDKILGLPKSLQDYYLNQIMQFEDYESDLKLILSKAIEKEFVNINKKVFNIVFGKYFDSLYKHISQISSNGIIDYNKENIESNNIKKLYYKLLCSLKENKKIANEYGQMTNDDYDIILKNEDGFGEWWDKDIYDDYNRNTLILYKNKRSMNKDDFLYTIAHEVYPGHGYFFDRIKNGNNDILLDSGAMFLIEGYATYVEFHIEITKYSQVLKQRYSKIALDMLEFNCEDTKNSLEKNIYMTQYIGYMESYYWGAFMIDYFITSGKFNNINEFLEYLSTNNISELFRLW